MDQTARNVAQTQLKAIVVMPTYNEAENIADALSAVLANGPEWHALVVDDNSPDKTGTIVDQLAGKNDHIHILHRPGKMGLGTAYRDGLALALESGADYVCTMDSDFSHDPAVLPRLRELAEQHGAAHGSRYVPGGSAVNWGFLRRMNSRMANFLTRLFLRVRLRDCTSGFRCFRRDVALALEPHTLTATGYAVLEEILYRCKRLGVSPAEYPITFTDRRLGQSKISPTESVKALIVLLKLACSGWQPEKQRPITRHPNPLSGID